MVIKSYEKEEQIRFTISEHDEKYRKILNMCFYKEEGGIFYKDFPKDYPHMEKVRNNFKKNGRDMFDQLGYFTKVPWEKALLVFCQMIEGSDIDWWLTGSCASCLRGINFQPHDVDIMISSRDVDKIAQIFSGHLIEPIVDTKGWLTKDFGVIFLHARIDIASDPVERLDDPVPIDCGPTAKKSLEIINWNGYSIKIPPISLQLNANRLRERNERVEMIEHYIKVQK